MGSLTFVLGGHAQYNHQCLNQYNHHQYPNAIINVISNLLTSFAAHYGPVRALQRNPSYTKNFLTVFCDMVMLVTDDDMITVYKDDEKKALLCGIHTVDTDATSQGGWLERQNLVGGHHWVLPHMGFFTFNLICISSTQDIPCLFLSLAKSALVINLKVNSGLEQLTDGCWSPTRPSLFFTTRMDGKVNTHHSNWYICYPGFMEAWDVIETQHSPIMTVKVQEGPLHCLSAHPEVSPHSSSSP